MQHQEKIISIAKQPEKKIYEALRKQNIGLTPSEAVKVHKFLKRDPTLTEAVIWGIQSSEHSSYKSSKHLLRKLPTTGSHVMLGPGEDSGIVEIAKCNGKKYGLVVCHESHNHPSQIVPFEGAATGIGGAVRDVVCMGARVIGIADSLRFGDIRKPETKMIAQGVIDGIAGYGNPIGVPNVGGDVYFNPAFQDNCLVNVIALGLVREDEIIHSRAPRGAAGGYDIIIVGKPTDLSGMGGASFASLQLNESEREKNKGAVQEPNPFLKRHLLASTYELFDILKAKKMIQKVGFKDLGAGGIMCATVEMVAAQGYGALIDLKKVHRAIDDLPPYVIACSETQERLCWIVPQTLSKLVLSHYNERWALPTIAKGASASVIGKVTRGNYIMTYEGIRVCDADPKKITAGISIKRVSREKRPRLAEPKLPEPRDYGKILLKILSHENVASRERVFESYDKNVQAIARHEVGVADAGVITPFVNRTDVDQDTRRVGIALSVDANPRHGLIDPYWQAANAIVEGCRNVASVGATPWCITDCLNYGNPEKPDHMFEFEAGIDGMIDSLHGIGMRGSKDPIPVISGNVSFYNATEHSKIPAQANICTIGRIADATKTIGSHIRAPGHNLYLIGPRKIELGGSVYYDINGKHGRDLPKPDFAVAKREIELVLRLVEEKLAVACHDISDGGLAAALAEMCIDSGWGAKVDISKIGVRSEAELHQKKGKKPKRKILRADIRLFSETGGFIIEIPRKNIPQAISHAASLGVPLMRFGFTTKKRRLCVFDHGKEIIQISIASAEDAWHNSLRAKLA